MKGKAEPYDLATSTFFDLVDVQPLKTSSGGL